MKKYAINDEIECAMARQKYNEICESKRGEVMKKTVLLTVVIVATVCGGCNNANRMFDSEIAAIRDQTKVLEKIEHHLAVIAAKVSEVK